ncbi:hypothetical protein [Mesorhizobium sp. M0684]|uniref:hypothetical protein n=1 Tax=Mesorhizobium sp. M0684 TaxID=2956986 RepID=UPI00333E0F76
MKVVMLVTASENGIAGHHFSVRDLATEFRAAGIDLRLVVVKVDESHGSKALQGQEHETIGANVLGVGAMRSLAKLVAREKFEAVICYDEFTTRIAVAALPFHRKLIIAVKPGWVNSDSWTNGVGKFVLFSKENFEYYSGRSKYQNVQTFLIPNRVSIPKTDPLLRDVFYSKLPTLSPKDKIIICPVRFDRYKEVVIAQAVRLQRYLDRPDRRILLLIVGSIADRTYYEEVRKRMSASPSIFLSHDERLTQNLSAIIGYADITVGVGRTAVEALLLKKAVYIPVEGEKLPTEITAENFFVLSHYNFTQRHGDRESLVDIPVSETASNSGNNTAGVALFDLVEEHVGAAGAVSKYMAAIRGSGGKIAFPTLLATYSVSVARVIALMIRSRYRIARARAAGRARQ